MATLGQSITDNPILAAARSNSTPAPSTTAPVTVTSPKAISPSRVVQGGAPTPIPSALMPNPAGTPTPAPIQSKSSPVATTSGGAAKTNSASNSVSISTTVVAKPEPGSVTDAYINDIEQGIEEAKKFTVAQNNAMEAAARKTKGLAGIQTDMAAQQATIELQKDTAQLEAQTNAKTMFDIGGGLERQVKLTDMREAQEDKVLETQKVVSDMVNDDSVLGFFKNLLFKGDAVEEANVARAGLDKIRDIQTQALGIASQTDQTLEDLQVTQSWATLDANQKLINLQGMQKQLEYSANADLLRANQFENARKMTNIEVQSVQSKWSMMQQDKVFKATQAERARLSKAAAKDRRVMEAVVANAINGMEKIGIAVYRGEDPALIEKQNVEVEAALSLQGRNRDKMLDMFEKGVGRVPLTKFEAFTGLSATNSAELKPEINPSAALLADAYSEVIAEQNAIGAGKVSPEATRNAFETKVTNKLDSLEKEIVHGAEGNPNSAQPMSWLVQQPGIADLPLVVKVVGSLFDENVKDMTPSKLSEIAFGHVKTSSNPEGQLTFDEALNGIRAIYQKVGVLNTEKQNRLNLGFAPQTTYKTKIKGLSPLSGYISSSRFEGAQAFAGSGAIIDMMDETQLRLLGVRLLAGQATPKNLEKVGLDPELAAAAGLPTRKERGILNFLTGGE